MEDTLMQELIQQAEKLEEQGAIMEALESWHNLLELKREPVFLCRYGLVAMEAGDSQQAREAFLEAIDLEPSLPNAHELLGIWYQDQGMPQEALRSFKASLDLEATPGRYTLLGATQLKLGMVAEARKNFHKALEMDPHNDEAYYNLGLTFSQDEPDAAITLFRKALELDPEFAAAHSELGQTLRRIDENTKAEYHLRKAIELDETDSWAYLYLGNILWLENDLISAETLFKKAIDLWPNSSVPLWCLAMFYQYQDRNEEADTLFRLALAIDPADPEAHKRFGMYLKDIGETATAATYFDRARVLNIENKGIH